ncbi:MAG: class I SAM-dependent methyltransferase [Candidatus Hodarchaeota archaeon]
MKKLYSILLKPLIFVISKLTIDKKVSLITGMLQGLISRENNPADSLKFLLKLDRNIYSLTGQESIRYGKGLHTKHEHLKYHSFFVENISGGDHVLDIGCGNGALSYDIVANVKDVKLVGIDFNKKNIEIAQKKYKHPNLEFVVGDALTDLPNEKFDVVILSNVLEHIEQRIEFLTRIKKKIKPSKYLLRVPLFERDWRVPLMKELGLDYRLYPTHCIEYSQEEFFDELKKVGLEIELFKICWGEIWAKIKE